MDQQAKGVRMFLLLSVLLSASCVPYVEAVFGIPDFLEYGTCANVTLMEDFDPVKYTGLWFDIASVPNEYQQTKACVSHKYTWRDDHMNVVSRGLSDTEQKIRVTLALLPDEERQPQHPAQMTVIAEGTPESPYQVIDTDYRTYSCVYSCLEYFGFRAEFSWIYARTPTVPESTVSRCHQSFTAMGVDHTKMTSIRQGESCPYFRKLDQLLKTNNQLMRKTLGPAQATPATARPPTTTTTTTTNPPTTTTTTTTNPPTTTTATTTPPTTTTTTTTPPTTATTTKLPTTTTTKPPTTTTTTTNPPTTTTTTTNPPTTTPTTTQPLTTTPSFTVPQVTNPPTTTSTTTSPPPTTSATSSPPSMSANVHSSFTTAPRPRPIFTLTSGRAALGTPTEEDEQSSQEERITASRQKTIFSSAREVTPSGGAWRQEVTQGSTEGVMSGAGPSALLLPLLGMVTPLTTLMILR